MAAPTMIEGDAIKFFSKELTISEMARFFNVTPGSISQRVKKLGIAPVRISNWARPEQRRDELLGLGFSADEVNRIYPPGFKRRKPGRRPGKAQTPKKKQPIKPPVPKCSVWLCTPWR